MFSSILKIIPKLDAAALKKMEQVLQSRFTKLAKGFGKGLTSAIKGGGIAAIGLSLIDKILNPLKEIQDAIDKTLKSSDEITTNAKQFNTTSGKLAKLITLGQSTGLDQDSLFMLINKFQNAVASAAADPKEPSSVRAFIGKTDSAEAFFEFMQSLQKLPKNAQLLAQQNVFGEKQILKMADFLQTDFKKQYNQKLKLNQRPTETLTKNIDSLAAKNDLAEELAAVRNLDNFAGKNKVIRTDMLYARDKSERLDLRREDQNIANYKNLASISDTSTKIFIKIEEMLNLLGGLVAKYTGVVDQGLGLMSVKSFTNIMSHLFSRGGKKDK